ncbi:MAG: peptide deformylase [Bacteroidales bacterium]|nr:peptide deformylase [Bacteroidales bacterium]
MIWRLIIPALACLAAASCQLQNNSEDFLCAELELIHGADSIMRVLTIRDSSDLAILRAKSRNLSASSLLSDTYAELEHLMTATVTHPSQDGVGIAGPQVGLNRRVVAVQRFDKDGYPFEVYPNIRIVWASDSLKYGPEGCLSVPEQRADVLRSQEIIIEYADMKALRKAAADKCGIDGIPMKRDTVKGFTAVIFQHETDHLDGILYIDRLSEQK